MTLDEAIKHCEEVADGFDETAQEIAMQDENGVYQPRVSWYQDRASNQRQLAEWLRELKAFHDAMDIIPTTPFDVDLGEIPINNRSYDDIVKCLMIAYERGKKDTLSLIEQYILGGKS